MSNECSCTELLHSISNALSGEWILTGLKSNGGTVIVLRSTFITIWMLAAIVLVTTFLHPTETVPATFQAWYVQFFKCLKWAGPIFGGVYLALYARFASQWSYLANVYNQIKQTEVEGAANERALNQWRAGYVEDAVNLHLALKSSVAPIVHAWMSMDNVRLAFETHTPAGPSVAAWLEREVAKVIRNEEERWVRKFL